MTEPERAAIMGQLVAIQNVLEGLIESLQADAPSGPCEHPEERRQYGGTMGAAFYTCGVCGAQISATSPPEGA